MTKPRLLVLGPNPARQKVLRFKHLNPGGVNRAYSLLDFASGKGGNFCRAALCAGKVSPLLIQAAGGENGRMIEEYFREENLPCITVPAGPSRCCISLCSDDGGCTEVIEPSRALSEEQSAALLKAFDENLSGAGMAVFCGSLPDGSNPEFYRRAAELACAKGIPLLLDTVTDLPELLKRACRAVVKINRSELKQVTQEDSIPAGIAGLFRYPALEFCAITDGPEAAYAAGRDALYRYTLPVLKSILSPIGCGDTCGAVLASEWLAGTPAEDAFASALAAASANCLTPVYGHFRKEDVRRIRGKMIMEKVTGK